MIVNPGLRRFFNRLPGDSSQTLFAGYDGSLPASQSYSRLSNAWNSETGLVSAHNLILQSNAFTTTWTLAQSISPTQDAIAPDGSTSAWTLNDSSGTNLMYVTQNMTLTAQPYILSAHVKKGVITGTGYPVINVFTASGSLISGCTIDPLNGVATVWTEYTGANIIAGSTASVVDYSADYWRVYLSFNGTASAYAINVIPAGRATPNSATGTTVGTVTGSVVFYGAQLNAYSITDYVPTTTAAVYMPRYQTGRLNQAILIEGASTNVFLNSQGTAAVTQNISLTTANSGKWTTTVYGAGQVVTSAGTATATGYGTATVGAPNTVTVTGAGTVTFTVSGATADTIINVENATVGSSPIVTGSVATTRAAGAVSGTSAGVIAATSSSINIWFKPTAVATGKTQTLWSSYTDASNWTSLQYIHGTGFTVTKRVAGTTTTVTHATTATAGTWYLCTLVINANNTLNLFVNGTQAGTNGTTVTGVPVIAATYKVGAFADTATGTLQADGLIDNERYFGRTLTISEHITYFNRGR